MRDKEDEMKPIVKKKILTNDDIKSKLKGKLVKMTVGKGKY